MKDLLVLGSTGSVGTQTLDVVRKNPGRFRITGLSANSNAALLIEQISEFKPGVVAVSDPNAAELVRKSCDCRVLTSEAMLEEIIDAVPNEIVVVALLGFAALKPVLRAIKSGKKIALANKECLVAAGELLNKELLLAGEKARIVPVDSEHSSIYQLLAGRDNKLVQKITLTASGGPFLRKTVGELREVTPAEAVKHPRWNMGAKISVDSATLMNKGLEVIEAAHLFKLPIEKIDVLVHPESLVHGFIEYTDGALLACCFTPDMRQPISYSLSELDSSARSLENGVARLDLAEWGNLTFEKPDLERFPALRLAYESFRIGQTAPTILNAANEVAVNAFLCGKLRFTEITDVIEDVLRDRSPSVHNDLTVEGVLAADTWARERTAETIGDR